MFKNIWFRPGKKAQWNVIFFHILAFLLGANSIRLIKHIYFLIQHLAERQIFLFTAKVHSQPYVLYKSGSLCMHTGNMPNWRN